VQHRAAAEAAANAARLQVATAHLERFGDKESVLRELGHTLRFPDWYGANLDALYDCLTDPENQPAFGQMLLISGLNRLQSTDPDSLSMLVEVFRSASEVRREAGTPLWVLLDTPADDLPTLPSP
jgi:RNAse (barnase) inhibitor barstar